MIGEKDIVIFDVRSPEEYKGEKILAKRGGHIPSAVNLEWNRVLEKEIPIYKPAEEIDLLLKKAGVTRDKRVVVYCHKAMRASHMYVTLRLMGFENLTVYEGSWIEWGNDPHTPVTNPS
ncbi:thiosulfate sulfurtransferase [Halalkalibacter wakoensis JCM 9140]|uniref:thiosulfate sulfurtransferase n=1 Tax=Halalkalibacter wakoensis JCM 9140 TaxID=1236970 RepID=W4QB98_9BACI|nr:thiosulfate sulfurtransferase [Halalkalibacter wakoensis JCM 9140]